MQTLNLSPPSKTFERIPVYIISGFLGSGKTTLLNRLLQDLPKSAVIINEFGSTPIDQQLLREHQMPLSTLVGGCLCCQVIGALTPLLKNLRLAWEKDHSAFERIIIETSGVANPEPVLDIILRERWLSKRYSLQGIIATVSATLEADYLDFFPEAQAQITWADTLVMTQTDLATPAAIATLEARLLTLAPAATRIQAVQGEVDLNLIFNGVPQYRKLRDTEMPDLPAHGFNSVSLQLEQPLPWERIEKALLRLMADYAHELVRVKGMLYTQGDKHPLLIQGTGNHLYPTTRLAARATDDGIGRLVMITHGEVNGLAESLMAHLKETHS
ncbi:MAG: GTP-binding protein [Methylococcaceae bacterium]|nr:GTP-binding protein [Methylococcaceae bacterium]